MPWDTKLQKIAVGLRVSPFNFLPGKTEFTRKMEIRGARAFKARIFNNQSRAPGISISRRSINRDRRSSQITGIWLSEENNREEGIEGQQRIRFAR